jgi:hypothetical protein
MFGRGSIDWYKRKAQKATKTYTWTQFASLFEQ